MKIIQRFKFGLPAIVIAVGIFIASHQSKIEIPEIVPEFNDKLLHALAYLIFGITIILALKKNHPQITRAKCFTLLLLIGGLYGMSDEIHQHFIPGRTADVYDWFADVTGILLSYIVFIPVEKYLFRKRQTQ